MNEYVFEVKLRAVVRVRASDEGVAREVVSSVLGAPGNAEINLIKQALDCLRTTSHGRKPARNRRVAAARPP